MVSSAGLTFLWAFQRTTGSAEVDSASWCCFSPTLFTKNLKSNTVSLSRPGLLEILVGTKWCCAADQSKHAAVLWHQFALGDSGAQPASHWDRENTVGQKPAGLEGLLKGLHSWAASHCFTDMFGVLLLAHLGFVWYLSFFIQKSLKQAGVKLLHKTYGIWGSQSAFSGRFSK